MNKTDEEVKAAAPADKLNSRGSDIHADGAPSAKAKTKKAKKPAKPKTEEEIEALEIDAKRRKDSPMTKIVDEIPEPVAIGDIVEGTVLAIDKSGVYVDIPPAFTGIIYARDIIKKVNVGDSISAKVVEVNNADGYIELSLKEARQAMIWSEAETMIKLKTALELPIKEANKGGLILEWQGIQGFLPASQLKSEHYPRVADGDKDKILEELRKLVGTRISVVVISALPKEGKLIFSEKSPGEKEKSEIIQKYEVGETVSGDVTGIVDFGIFVKLEDGLEGLVHISEIDWALVEDPKALFKIGDKVKVKIIEIKEGKISLSIKALKENPWKEAASKYKKETIVQGVVIKFNKHGALAAVEEGIAGLVHISEFGGEDKLRAKLELGKSYTFKINLFDPKEQKMALSFVDKEVKK